jgi:hypothetical protein
VKKLFKVSVPKSITVIAEDVDTAKAIAAAKLKLDDEDAEYNVEFISNVDVVATRSKK